MTQEVIALRDIEPGEEIAHSCKYCAHGAAGKILALISVDVPIGKLYDDRREELRKWGFDCKCPLCSGPKQKLQQSDRARERVVEIGGQLQKERIPKEEIRDLVDEFEYLMVNEGLWLQLPAYYEFAARAFMKINEIDEAWRYARKSGEEWLRYGGADHAGRDQMRRLGMDLENWVNLDLGNRQAWE
jgi:hypothetical protein